MRKYRATCTIHSSIRHVTKGQTYLSKTRKNRASILTHTKTFDHPTLHIERKANSVYFSIMKEPLRTQLLKRDATHHPIRYDETTAKFL